MTTSKVSFDPFSDDFFNAPFATYRRMRDEAPVYYNEIYDFYALTRHEDVTEALKDVMDPELGINVVDLGLVYGMNVEKGDTGTVALIDMTLTSAACPLTDVIEDQTAQSLEGLVESFRINWVWMPPWGPDKITDDGREQLRALGFNV